MTSTIPQALERDQIVPDVINSFSPSILFSIIFPSGKEALLGNELLKEDTLEEPDIVFTSLNIPAQQASNTGEGSDVGKEVSYTLVLTDPDAPSRQVHLFTRRISHMMTLVPEPIPNTGNSDIGWQVFITFFLRLRYINSQDQITGITAPSTTSSQTESQIALKPKAATTPYRPPGPGPGSGLHRYSRQTSGFSN